MSSNDSKPEDRSGQMRSADDQSAAPDQGISQGGGHDEKLDERLEQLKSKLESTEKSVQQRKDAAESHNTQDARAGIGHAFRLSSEFIAGVVVGAGIGYLVDTFFGTSPWGLIFFLLLGFAAAVLNVLRAAGMVAESQMRLKPAHELHKQHENDDSGSAAKK